jgi:hypothetical protein
MLRRGLLIVLLCAACSHRQRLPDGSIAFLEVRSEHFRLRTDLPAAEARQAVVELERVRNAFLVSLFSPDLDTGAPLDVVALAGLEEMAEFAPPRTLGFFAQSATGQRMIALSGDDPAGSAVLRHELAHHLLYLAIPRQPRWFSEGVACYLETTRFDRSRGQWIVGEPDQRRLEYSSRNPVTHWDAVLKMGPQYMSGNPGRAYAFETHSWLLFHFLANTHPAETETFLGRLQGRTDPLAAFAASYPGMDEQRIGEGVHAYLHGGKYLQRFFAVAEPEVKVQIRQLSSAETHALRARLLAAKMMPGWLRPARQEVALALAADPGEPEALAVDFEITKRPVAEQIESARTAVRLHPRDPRAALLLAERLPAGRDRHLAIERALELVPDDPDALRLGAFDSLEGGRLPEGLDRARRAQRVAATDPRALDVLAAALAVNGRCAEAGQVEQRALEVLPDGTPETTIRELQERAREMSSGSLCLRPVAEDPSAGVKRRDSSRGAAPR